MGAFHLRFKEKVPEEFVPFNWKNSTNLQTPHHIQVHVNSNVYSVLKAYLTVTKTKSTFFVAKKM